MWENTKKWDDSVEVKIQRSISVSIKLSTCCQMQKKEGIFVEMNVDST